ncbi:S8 family serine peptidase [Halogeometricum sp. CBA1124]|uniref:S8 family serine peptidase n=1 Tax=Halogeometricum sp. CBA1124 TaxID=2668071 RepID=UPI0031B6D57A
MFDGIEVEHHNFTGAPDEPCDDVGHGTAVAGLIAQLSPGIERIVDLRIFGKSGSGNSKPIFDAYDWARSHADELATINLSWGSSERNREIDHEHTRLMTPGCKTSSRRGTPARRAAVRPPRWTPTESAP